MKDNTKSIRIIKSKLHNVRNRALRIKAELLILGLEIGVKEACRRRGYSRVYWYKWWRRFKASSFCLESLKEKTRRPQRSPRRISATLEFRIRRLARKGYGAPMIQAHLRLDGVLISQSTIGKVIRGRRKNLQKERPLKPHRRRYELLVPGERVQVDVKYVPYPIDGRRVYNYVAVDECTRLRFIKTYTELNAHSTIDFLENMKRAIPFKIYCIQTDNGFEFTNKLNPHASKWEHQMETWCVKNGIRHRLIPPGEKELNGKVERSHRIDEEFFYQKNNKRSYMTFIKAQAGWLSYYNTKRLHGGLGFITPAQKLEERYRSLEQICFLDKKLEQMRVDFITQKPKEEKEEKNKIQTLEKWLLLLKYSA